MKLIQYNNVSDFLRDSNTFLTKKEVENNLILGVCYNLLKNDEKIEEAVFLNVFQNDSVVASSIKTIPKAIIASEKNNPAIKKLAVFYESKNIYLKGIIGQADVTESFITNYNKPVTKKQKQFIYSLENVKEVKLSSGEFQLAEIKDKLILNQLVDEFYNESKITNKKPIEQLIKSKKVFTWRINNEIVTIAAIIRETENTGIIGMVYTPKKFRNNGYATSCVKKLSERILENGYKFCGLFTDASNPTSNKIYINIGYKKVSEFQDILFE